MLNKYFKLELALLLLFQKIEASELFVHVDNAIASEPDQYICSDPFEVTEPDIFVSEFAPKLNEKLVHHLLLLALKFVHMHCISFSR